MNLSVKLPAYDQQIVARYQQPSQDDIEDLHQTDQIVPLHSYENIIAVNQYYQDALQGTNAIMYTRQSVLQRLQWVVKQLLPDYGLLVFDTYRSIETQTSLFNNFSAEIHRQHPDWNEAAILQETLRFVSHPTDPSHFAIPLHNSGGAVDLAICNFPTQTMLNFGTAFDEINNASVTDFFEQNYQKWWGVTPSEWLQIRAHRRILFHLMKAAGFINYENEWWHFDLGDCYWSNILGIDWIYDQVVLV